MSAGVLVPLVVAGLLLWGLAWGADGTREAARAEAWARLERG